MLAYYSQASKTSFFRRVVCRIFPYSFLALELSPEAAWVLIVRLAPHLSACSQRSDSGHRDRRHALLILLLYYLYLSNPTKQTTPPAMSTKRIAKVNIDPQSPPLCPRPQNNRTNNHLPPRSSASSPNHPPRATPSASRPPRPSTPGTSHSALPRRPPTPAASSASSSPSPPTTLLSPPSSSSPPASTTQMSQTTPSAMSASASSSPRTGSPAPRLPPSSKVSGACCSSPSPTIRWRRGSPRSTGPTGRAGRRM